MNIRLKVFGVRLRRAFSEQTFGRAIIQIMSGNAISQVIMLLALPVITRIYAPEQMSLLALYVAILTMIAVTACLRLEIAIPIPKSDETAANVTALALLSAITVTGLVAVVLLVVWATNIQYLTGHLLWKYAWLFPLGTLSAGLFATMQYWSVRKKRFSLIGGTRVLQAVVGVGTQIAAGLLHIVPLGLLLGHLLMTSAGAIGLFRSARKNEKHLFRAVSRKQMRHALDSYADFPKFSIVEGLATTGAQQITIMLISFLAVGAEAGFFFLALRALSAPVSMITNAVSQTYLQRAPQHLRNGTLRSFTGKVLASIAIISGPPFILLGIFSVPIFRIVFGEEWARSGEIAILILPMTFVSLFSASIGMVMNVTGQQKKMMWLKVLGFLLRVGSTSIAAFCFDSVLIETFAISSFIYYATCAYVFYIASVKSAQN